MKFYFYTNKNIMFDFLGRNIIAPDPIIKDIKGYRTIGTASDYFLFVTHMKLNRQSREHGINEPEFVYPMTLELSDVREEDGQAVLVSKVEGEFEYTLESLKDYDQEKHVGAYIFGEIPLSRVEKIYFDSQDDWDMFSRPSLDYWYPVNKYSLLSEDFTEELILPLEEEKIINVSGLNPDIIIQEIQNRERLRAALLNLVIHTGTWHYDKYLFSIDHVLQNLFGIKDEDISEVLPHYLEMRDKDNKETTIFIRDVEDVEIGINQIIYDITRAVFVRQPFQKQKQPEDICRILDSIVESAKTNNKKEDIKIMNFFIGEIKELISDSSKKSPDEILSEIQEPIDMFKAILFVAKNPNKYELFLESLKVYHATIITKRRAAVLWGLLNGLYGMPGEGFNKDNQELWRFIEAYIYTHSDKSKLSLSLSMPEVGIVNNTVLGLVLKENRVISAGEVRRLIMDNHNSQKEGFYDKLFEIAVKEYGSKKKAEEKNYAYRFASVDLPDIKKGQELTIDIKKKLEQLLKDTKVLHLNENKLYMDYVKNEEKFTFVFNLDPSYWKRIVKPFMGN